jgi:glycosyltransferase involved in cell wall biosynthesis
MTRPLISVVTPCYNEEGGIAECYEGVKRVFVERLPDCDYEHIFIDNCSRDRTVAILKDIAARDRNVKIIVNARNFGPSRSPHHAILESRGDAVTPVLADLQTPATIIPEMVARWREGFKVVVAVRKGTTEGFVARNVRSLFYSLIKRLSKVDQIPNFIGYGLYDRQVVDVMRRLYDPEPYFRGLVPEIGFARAVVEYDQPDRRHGKSRHSLWDLIDVAMVALSTYSKAPMRVMTVAGAATAGVSLLAGFAYLVAKLIYWNSIPVGIAPLLLATLFIGAVQLLALGLLGEYVVLLLQYARRFPLVVESERVNFD